MDSALTFSLILSFLCIGQSYAEREEICYDQCPPGYHKDGICDNAKHRCKRCEADTYTVISNLMETCLRCDKCGSNEKQIEPCSSTSNVVCECKEGFYNAGGEDHDRHCLACPNGDCGAEQGQSFKKKCQSGNCLDCGGKCVSDNLPSLTTPDNTKKTSKVDINKSTSAGEWILPLIFLTLTAVVVLCGVIGVLVHLYGDKDDCFCCETNNKDLSPAEDCFNEEACHQGCSLTTLTLNLSEEAPMMSVSQSPGHPVHMDSAATLSEHTAARQKDQSQHWPAIVLYAIIREVPVRRWKEFLRLLSVADRQLERVEMEAGQGLCFTERQYQMLRLWSQRSEARLSDIFFALHNMDLSGCAQLLQESLEKLQGRPEPAQGPPAAGGVGGEAPQDT